MKVLFINDVHTIGGATMALKELLLELKDRGIEPIVCTSTEDDFNVFMDENAIGNIADGHREVMEIAPKSKIKRVLKYLIHKPLYVVYQHRALRIIETRVNLNEIDIIHTNSARNDLGCLIYKKYHIPHVMHLREFGVEDYGCMIYRKGYCRILNENCSLILSVSDAVRKAWISRGVDSEKCRVLYDGVDFRNFVVKENNYIQNGIMRLVIVGYICETKGQSIAIEALSKLPENVKPHVSLDIIGQEQPGYVDRLKKRATELGVSDCLRFLGEKNDIGGLLHKYNVGLMCSKSEGFGRATIEYMYAGLCVIAANTGASPELINDRVNGLIYKRDDPDNLAKKITQLYAKQELLGFYGHRAHDDVYFKFTAERNADEVIKVYRFLSK